MRQENLTLLYLGLSLLKREGITRSSLIGLININKGSRMSRMTDDERITYVHLLINDDDICKIYRKIMINYKTEGKK